MENFIINATKYTPKIEIRYDEHLLRIEGESYPENARETFQPLLDKLEDYFSKPDRTLKVELLVDYLNTSSSKMMTDIINNLQNHFEDGHKIDLTWFYPEGDIDCQETCELFLEDVTFPYTIAELKD